MSLKFSKFNHENKFSNSIKMWKVEKSRNSKVDQDDEDENSMQRNRSISDSSDDWIEFVNEDDDQEMDESEDFLDNFEFETDSDEGSSFDESEEEMETYENTRFEDKKVRFNLKTKVHVIRVWEFAHRACRKGDYWLQFARDNERFKRRIQEHEKVLKPIFALKHREQIFNERFITQI